MAASPGDQCGIVLRKACSAHKPRSTQQHQQSRRIASHSHKITRELIPKLTQIVIAAQANERLESQLNHLTLAPRPGGAHRLSQQRIFDQNIGAHVPIPLVNI
jgi:hypothetical protein